jgi:signal peptidase I
MRAVRATGPATVAFAALGLALAALVAMVRKRWVAVTVIGDSMVPTYHDGDLVLVRRRRPSDLTRGDVVVLEAPAMTRFAHRWNLKRVAALPGDPVPGPARASAGVDVVPGGSMVVFGDNTLSLDSRQAGLYPASGVLGVAVRRVDRPAAAARRTAVE